MKAFRGVCVLLVALGFAIDATSVFAKPKLDTAVGGGVTRPTKGDTIGSSGGKTVTGKLPVNPPVAVADDPPSPGDDGASIRGASPALGPAPAKAPVSDIGVDFLLTSALRQRVADVLTAANLNLAQQTSVRAKVSLDSLRVFSVGPSATAYTDRPNHHFVRVPYMLSYRIHEVRKKTAAGWVATGVTRKLSQSIALEVFCDGWETGKGTIKVTTKIEPLYLEDSQGTAEQIVDFFLNGHLTQLIDGLVRQQLSAIAIADGSASTPFSCSSLSANRHGTADTADDTIDFNRPSSKTLPRVPTALSQVTFKLLRVERLLAKDVSGRVLYQEVESPQIEIYAGFARTGGQLSALSSGQSQVPTFPQLSLTKPPNNGPLVIIANVIQADNASTTDSAYRVFAKETNYGSGTRALIIKKSYWRPPSPPLNKPTEFFVDAYKLVFQIGASSDQVASAPGVVKSR